MDRRPGVREDTFRKCGEMGRHSFDRCIPEQIGIIIYPELQAARGL